MAIHIFQCFFAATTKIYRRISLKSIQLYSVFSFIEKSWIGYSDAATEGEWKWEVEKKQNTYINWAEGQPDDSGDQDCAALLSGSGEWDDVSCTSALPFICEFSKILFATVCNCF